MKKVILLSVLLLVLCSCGEQVQEQQEIVEETLTEENVLPQGTQEHKEPVCVSPMAKEHFLEPLEDYSWEREYPAEKVVLHFTSAVMLSRDDPYNMEAVRSIFEDNSLSIHYIIDRDGVVYCYMPESRCAWHAGVGTFGNDEKYTNSMNKYSIGIEIVAMGSQKDMAQYLTKEEYSAIDSSLFGFTDAQYTSLDLLLDDICTRNGIPMDRDHIIGHDEYNPAKSDPGELFDWNRVLPDAG